MKKRWIGISVAAAVAVAALSMNLSREKTIEVQGVILHPQRVEQTVSCAGVVEAADGVPVLLPIDCRIKKVKVKEGQRVKKGDVLATLDRENTGIDVEDPSQRLLLAALEDTVTSPEDGVVVSVQAKSGIVLEKGTPCVVIAQDSDIQVRIGIREKDLKRLKKGMAVRVRGEGFSKDFYDGKLSDISSAARTESEGGTIVEGVVTLTEGQVDSSLRLGLTAKASVITSVEEEGLVIPYDALLSDEQGDYVFTLENGKSVIRRVKSSVHTADGVLVTNKGWNGTVVITQPQDVEEGMTVALTEEVL